MTAIGITSVELAVERPERDRRQGIATEARAEARAYVAAEFGWEAADITIELMRQGEAVSTFRVTVR